MMVFLNPLELASTSKTPLSYTLVYLANYTFFFNYKDPQKHLCGNSLRFFS